MGSPYIDCQAVFRDRLRCNGRLVTRRGRERCIDDFWGRKRFWWAKTERSERRFGEWNAFQIKSNIRLSSWEKNRLFDGTSENVLIKCGVAISNILNILSVSCQRRRCSECSNHEGLEEGGNFASASSVLARPCLARAPFIHSQYSHA